MDTPLSRGRNQERGKESSKTLFSCPTEPLLASSLPCAPRSPQVRPSSPAFSAVPGLRLGLRTGRRSSQCSPIQGITPRCPSPSGTDPVPPPSVLALRNTRSQRERFHSRTTPSLRIRQETSEASSTGASRSEYERSPFRQGCGTCPLAPPSKAFPFWCHSRAALVFSKGLSARMLSKSRLA